MCALQRSYLRKLALSLEDKENVYGSGPAAWTAGAASSMLDFEESSAVATWDDTVVNDLDVVTGKELISIQEIPRESVRLTYQEPRAKPHSIAGLMALCMGTVAATQDGAFLAWRQKITKAASTALPSIGAIAKFEAGDQRQMRGLKGDSWSLSINGPYLQFQSEMIGSGYRATDATAFPASISESWLRTGDARIFIKDTAGTPITTSGAPTQGSANLGGSEVNFSTRVRSLTINWNNSHAAEAGYRASTAKLRGNFHPVRRAGTMSLAIDVDTATEATDLAYYLTQKQLAFELNVDSGVLIDAAGAFKYGIAVIIPRVQLTSIPRSSTDEFDVLTFEGAILDDGTNSELIGYTWNAVDAYLV